jgi:hypothetical protein
MPVVDGHLFVQGQLTASSITASGVLASSLSVNSLQVSSGVVIGAGVSTGGNTQGNTGTQTGTLAFQGSNNITLSQITGGAGVHTLQISKAAAGGGGGAVTMSMYPWPVQGIATQTVNSGTTAATGGAFQTTCSIYLVPMPVAYDLSYRSIEMIRNYTSRGGTATISKGYLLGIYSMNGGTLSLVSSYVHNHIFSQNSITAQSHYWYWGTNSTSNSSSLDGNVFGSFSGIRRVLLYDAEASLAASQYWQGVVHTWRSSGDIDRAADEMMIISASQTTLGNYIGESDYRQLLPYMGVASTTSNGTTTGLLVMPASIHTSAISGASTSVYRSIWVKFDRI